MQAGFRVLSFDLPEPQDTKILPRTRDPESGMGLDSALHLDGWTSKSMSNRLVTVLPLHLMQCKQVGEVDS